jgi:hypothetical protein
MSDRSSSHPSRLNISRVPHLPGLDGMRALAVVAVMVYHANSGWLHGGFLGVEVFFVISGYLITLLLVAEHERDDSIDLKAFWIRRFRRLLPALYLMLVLVIVYLAVFFRQAQGRVRGDVERRTVLAVATSRLGVAGDDAARGRIQAAPAAMAVPIALDPAVSQTAQALEAMVGAQRSQRRRRGQGPRKAWPVWRIRCRP